MNYLDALAYLKIDLTPTFDNKILVLPCRENKMIESLCKEMVRNDRQVEREKGRGEAAEFSGFRRRWWLLGWVRSQLSQRGREKVRAKR